MPRPNLTDFLLARIAEDEAAAGTPDSDDENQWQIDAHNGNGWPSMSPSRLMAECNSKRQIIAVAVPLSEWDAFGSATDEDGDAILLALALPYEGHPDYRDEWSQDA